MRPAVLLLSLMLIGLATSQSTPETPAVEETSVPPKEIEDKASSVKPEDEKPADSEEGEEDEEDPVVAAESQRKFTFSPADAKPRPKAPEASEEVGEGDAEGDDAGDVLLDELTAFISEMERMNSSSNGTDGIIIKMNDGDESDEEGNNDEEGENEEEIEDEVPSDDAETADSKPEESQIKRLDKFENKASSLDFDKSDRQGEIPAPPPDEYVTARDEPVDSYPENDHSPLLQLTQGGYSSPYAPITEIPRVRAQSASQQSETVENPTADVDNDEQFRQPQVSPQVSYADPFQSPFGFGSALGLRHPFIPPDSFVNSNGMVHQPVQSGFFNVPPAGFTDFSGTNFQAPFSPSNDGGFARNPSISLFQTSPEHMVHNPGFMVQNSQFPRTQFLTADPTQPAQTLYQTTGFANYPGSENMNAAPRPEYSGFFRNPSPNNQQFQVSNNPFAPPRTPSGMLFNPMMQMQPHFIPRPQYSPQYPAPNQQVQVQSTAPEEQKQKDSEKINEGETKNTEEQVNASPNTDDSASVPYGARILRQNVPEPQTNFPPDVYIRYPVKEAGYATEESLPVQNTTTKTETKSEPSPQRSVFSFFPTPGQFGDPYRNGLNSIHQGYAVDADARNNDDSNGTKQIQPDQLPPNMAFPFNEPPAARPIPRYPSANPIMRPPSFFQTPDQAIGNPFDDIIPFPERFPVPLQTSGQTQESSALPACVHGQTNASVCFEDPEYPRREVMFALRSDPFILDRFSTPDQDLDPTSLMEQDRLEHPENAANYICSSKIRYGLPLRAKDVSGQWKVIVNIEKGVGRGRFVQPVKLEVCKGAGEPCNFTQVKTACVQKYSFHRLISWNSEKGIHNDVFKLPVACSCQLLQEQTS